MAIHNMQINHTISSIPCVVSLGCLNTFSVSVSVSVFPSAGNINLLASASPQLWTHMGGKNEKNVA